MRVFEQGSKINFVDTNDVYVGFDAFQCCCEDFGYHFAFSSEKDADEVAAPGNLEDLIFDVSFFEEREAGWGGGQAVFRLFLPRRLETDRVNREAERAMHAVGGVAEVFLVLFNHHNGYYGHGFDMTHGGTVVQSGCL